MLNEQELERSPIFHDISYQDYQALMICFQAVRRSFQGDAIIYDFSSDIVGVVERGQADLIRIDEDGVFTVLESLGTGAAFGKTLAFAGLTDSLKVVCRHSCDVVFIDYSHILSRCPNICQRHGILLQNMLNLMADKAKTLSYRVDVLSRRSIREKLMCYFRQLSLEAGSRTFTLPFSLSTLADYIATDRGAMMRELKWLREEGVISKEGREFTLHQGHCLRWVLDLPSRAANSSD